MKALALSLSLALAVSYYSMTLEELAPLQTGSLRYENHSESKWVERKSLQKHFREAGVKGSFLLYDLQKNEYLGYDLKRAKTPFIPASTYKIFNSLVALETGVVRDENEILKWDGVKRKVPAWNQDQDMKSAIGNSTVWFYQELARRIGQERMQHYLELARYGNRDMSGGIDQFWLEGGLKITPKEQIDLLVNLYRGELPFSQKTMNLVKEILINEKTDAHILRAKTGWSQAHLETPPAKRQIGWWVGYVERGGNAYFFALNIDIAKDEDASARKTVAKNILRELNVIN